MVVDQNELDKIKDELRPNFKLKVYKVYSKSCYSGTSYVYAENAEEANRMIRNFRLEDAKNVSNSFGYSGVSEDDWTEEYTDEEKQIIPGIYYHG